MALTYIFRTQPSALAVAASGKNYSANANGIITGVAPADALTLQGVGGATVRLMAATGATADRPMTTPAALTGAINSIAPFPEPGLPFHDTTLGSEVYRAPASPTGYTDYTGTAA